MATQKKTHNRYSKRHAFIPDTQITPESDVGHIAAAANYLAEKEPEEIVIIGDWWDMKSLSVYDKPGGKGWESKDYSADLECGIESMQTFLGTIKRGSRRTYRPRVHFCMGNHEERMARAAADPMNRRFSQFLSYDQLKLDKMPLPIHVHDFQEILELDGILYSHYFVNPDSLMGNAIGGSVENKLRKIGQSFSMGHQQCHQSGSIFTATGRRRRGLVSGRFYSEYQGYLGPQKHNQSWSGIVLKNEVHNGDYDMLEVSENYLREKWA